MIVLPLKSEKVQQVREQLKQLSPETLLFLSKLRQLVVREEFQNSICVSRRDLSTDVPDPSTKATTVNLSVGSNDGHISEESTYQLLQRKFPVTHPLEQRKEVDNWDITIGFPLLGQRINPDSCSGDIFAFLPSYLTSGFPFVINADFLLVSSRETLMFDSPWNIGILSCVPEVFLSGYKLFLHSKLQNAASPAMAVREAYRYIPVQQPQNTELRKVQKQILNLLRREDCVLVDSIVHDNLSRTSASGRVGNVFCKPEKARLIKPKFRDILVAANAERNVNPAIRNMQWYVVNCELQEKYWKTLSSLGVTDVTEDDYKECLAHEDWLLSLSEGLYWEVVCFVLNDYKLQAVPILKYLKEDGSIELASVEEARSTSQTKIYLSPSQKGDWLSRWVATFKPWVSVLLMPSETVRVLKTCREQKSNSIICKEWDSIISVVPELSVSEYLFQLLPLLSTTDDPKFVILTTEFTYQCLQGKEVDPKFVSVYYKSNGPIVNRSGRISRIRRDTKVLLPAHGSLWPKLSMDSWSNQLVAMSDDYVKTPWAWSSRLKIHISSKEDNLELKLYQSYLSTVVGASDIPKLIPPDGPSVSIPAQLSSSMTFDQVCLLLQWLTTWHESRTARTNTPFFQEMKEICWLPTEAHGRRQPSSCFDRSSVNGIFKSSDVPIVHFSLSAYGPTLEDLGVITDIEGGCDAVVNHILEISSNISQTVPPCNLEQVTRLYTYLQRFMWKPATASTKLKILVPNMASHPSNGSWQERESCVLYESDDGFFDKSLNVLESWYPRSLLPFFADVLKVPCKATVERYCQQWLKWRSDVHEITVEECTRLWKILAEKRKDCDAKVWKEFVAKAWVPSKLEITTAFRLLPPSACFIPDDLHLHSLFPHDVHFVWYPDSTEKMESAMNELFVEMGVKKLTESVQAEFIIDCDDSVGHDDTTVRASGSEVFCQGFFRAILGFLAMKKYGFSTSKRQSLLDSLEGVAHTTITRPLTRSYRISGISPPVTVTQDNVMALWSKTDGKLYCLGEDNPILQDPLARREFHVQLATTISIGLLSEHPLVADEATEFILGLLPCGFEASHVEHELTRKNAKLYEEDENFLLGFRT